MLKAGGDGSNKILHGKGSASTGTGLKTAGPEYRDFKREEEEAARGSHALCSKSESLKGANPSWIVCWIV